MFNAKDYLLSECANITQVLKESLRFRYRNVEFYNECEERLGYFGKVIAETPATEDQKLFALMEELGHLAVLIFDIERSHLEEFSWPFAYGLERVSKSVCDALFFFRAEGGMSSYAVRPEGERPGVIDKRINSVVFPRALKDSVLLHAILGHEIGHAIMEAHPAACSAFMADLIKSSPVADPGTLFEFCKRNNLVLDTGPTGHADRAARSWGHEFLCDLLGLLIMGPSFMAAFCSLLEIRSFKKPDRFVTSHPPFKSRVVALLHAARALGLIYSELQPDADLGMATATMDRAFVSKASQWAQTPFAIIDVEQIRSACGNLRAFAAQYPSLSFPRPEASQLTNLLASLRNDIPPAGGIELTDDGLAPLPARRIDFRHVVLAGWIRWAECEPGDIGRFNLVNRLCSYAIMQQEGVSHWHEHTPTASPT